MATKVPFLNWFENWCFYYLARSPRVGTIQVRWRYTPATFIVRDLNDTVRYVATVPPGTLVNSSGTAGTLLAAMAEAGATGALTGLPLPIASGIRQIIKMRQEGRTKAKINDALNALPIAPP